MKINADEVSKAFLECFYLPEEITDEAIPTGAVLVDGIMGKYGFHPVRLEHQRDKVEQWISALPHQFRKSVGGGWSFLNACSDEDGEQWTGDHQRMEQLFCLAIGLGLAHSMLPREMWDVLPGGMPYYSVEVTDASST